MTPDELIQGLPGEELAREGLSDLKAGRETPASCLAVIGLPRLRRAGLIENTTVDSEVDAELRLYRLLRKEGGDAYSRYNALLRRWVSFEQALDRRLRMGEAEKLSSS